MAKQRRKSATFEKLVQNLESIPSGELKPRLEGYAHRFTLLLPILSGCGDPVFSELQCSLLFRLFERRFEGFLANTAEGHPPWFGSWLPPGAHKPVIDRHIQIVVWTAPVDEAKVFFKYLKAILQRPEVAIIGA